MASKKIYVDLDLQNASKVTNLAPGTAAGDAVNKQQLDDAVQGTAWKDEVIVATQANINLASPGATIDGVTMVAGERFWAPSQGTATQDGLYVWNGASVPATRAPEMPVGMDVAGMLVSITEGTDAGKIAQVTNAVAAGVIGTHGLTDAFI